MLEIKKGLVRIILLVNCVLVAATSNADVTIKSDVVYGHKDGMALVYGTEPANPISCL